MVKCRFAPSPTGFIHVGNARTALINWLYARKNNGQFILRIDDTDQMRSKDQYVEQIMVDLKSLNIDWDFTFKQSNRLVKYQQAKDFLISSGRLYPCYESKEELEIKKKSLLARNLPPIYDRSSLRLTDKEKSDLENSGIKPHWRFLLKHEEINWHDRVRGDMKFYGNYLNDPILFKSDGTMTYALASVFDDIEYKITDIIRGEDHLSNSATHIQLFQALEADFIPNFAHICLLYNKDQEISKRLGGFEIKSLLSQGIEAMAINSFLSKVGTSDSIKSFANMNDLIEDFAISKFNKAAVNYDISSIEQLNKKIIQHMSYDDLQKKLSGSNILTTDIDLTQITSDFWQIIQKNINSLLEIKKWHKIIYGPFNPIINNQEICHKAAIKLEQKDYDDYSLWLQDVIRDSQQKKKDMVTIRLALTGLNSGPELGLIVKLLGVKKAIARLQGINNE